MRYTIALKFGSTEYADSSREMKKKKRAIGEHNIHYIWDDVDQKYIPLRDNSRNSPASYLFEIGD